VSVASRLAICRQQLPNGIVVLGHERSIAGSVVVRASFLVGAVDDPPGKEGLAFFTARVMQRGTSRHTFQQISELTDGLGASLNVDAGLHTIEVGARCLDDDLGALIDLMAEIIREPIFPADEIERFRGQLLTGLREQADDTRSVVERRFRELAYPPGHPYHRWPLGDETSVARIARDDLVAFHRRYVQPNRLCVSYAGGVRFDAFCDQVARSFTGWSPTVSAARTAIPDAPPPETLVRRDYPLPGKTQSDLGLGRPTLRRADPDFYALGMADLILGGLGLSGRLGEVVRDAEGLAYYVSSNVDVTFGPAPWEVQAGVNPGNLERAIGLIREEVERIRTAAVREEELADSKSYLTGILPLSLETNDGVARLLQRIERFDLGLDYLDRYPSIINALTRDQVLDAARTYFSADRIVVVTAGP
jgi:zinc protease